MMIYDVYLQKRLTEIEAIITQLVQRDTFPIIMNQLYLFCEPCDIQAYKSLHLSTDMIIDTNMDDFLKTIFEKSIDDLILDTEMQLSELIPVGGETDFLLFANQLMASMIDFVSGSSSMEMSVSPLDYFVAYSLGRNEFKTLFNVEQLDFLKTAFEEFEKEMQMDFDAICSSTKSIEIPDSVMYLFATSFPIFYLVKITCEAEMYLDVLPIDEYTLKKIVSNIPEDLLLLYATSSFEFLLQKAIEVDISQILDCDISEALIDIVFPETIKTELFCEGNAGLVRYRKLYEMDDLKLADFDNMMLKEVDYVTIAD